MSIIDKKGINVTSGFKLISPQPIDARMVVDDETELQSIITNGGAYEGQLVYVKGTAKYMKYNGTAYEELATGGGSGGSSEWSLIHTVTGGASDGGNIIFEGLNLDTNYNDYIFELSASFISVLSYTKKLATDDIIYQLNTYLIDLSFFGGASMSLCYLAYAYNGSTYDIIIQFYDSNLQPITDNAGVNQLATVLKLNIYAK